jgi:hypothetical protein
VGCSAIETSKLLAGRRNDAVIAWDLAFLLNGEAQRELITRVSSALTPGGSHYYFAGNPAT